MRTQSFDGRWSRIRVNCKQISDGVFGSGKLEVGGIDNFGDKRSAARNLNRLGVVMRFFASSNTLGPGFGAPEILGTGKFVAAVVDDVVR